MALWDYVAAELSKQLGNGDGNLYRHAHAHSYGAGIAADTVTWSADQHPSTSGGSARGIKGSSRPPRGAVSTTLNGAGGRSGQRGLERLNAYNG